MFFIFEKLELELKLVEPFISPPCLLYICRVADSVSWVGRCRAYLKSIRDRKEEKVHVCNWLRVVNGDWKGKIAASKN